MRPQILILDNATSSVDSHTELALQRGLREHARGMTVLVISQRVSSVMVCDRILVLYDGAISQQGAHESLAAAPGLYGDMVAEQLLETA